MTLAEEHLNGFPSPHLRTGCRLEAVNSGRQGRQQIPAKSLPSSWASRVMAPPRTKARLDALSDGRASTWEITPQQPRTPKPMIKTHTLVTLVTLDHAVGEVFRVNTRQKSPATYYPYLQSKQATTLGFVKEIGLSYRKL